MATGSDVWSQEATGGLDGLNAALQEALSPCAPGDLEELTKKIQQRISKQSSKFYKDTRMHGKLTSTQAKGLVEEFVEAVMSAIGAACQDLEWFPNVNFTKVLMFATMYTFGKAKCFSRTLAPMIEKHIEEGVFKWQEEERLQKCMQDAVDSSGVAEGAHKKKAVNHLSKGFDEAYLKAPYGSCTGDTPETSLLMDFVKGWIAEFVQRAWNVLENGIGAGSKDEQILFVTVLFQNLCDSNNPCIPFEIVQAMEVLPPAPWDFVGKAVEMVFEEAVHASAEGAAIEASGDSPWPASKKKRKKPAEEEDWTPEQPVGSFGWGGGIQASMAGKGGIKAGGGPRPVGAFNKGGLMKGGMPWSPGL